MKSIEAAEFNQFIHKVRNSLNSITLHAELGKILIDDRASTEQIKNAFTVILQQCNGCERILAAQRKNNTENSAD